MNKVLAYKLYNTRHSFYPSLLWKKMLLFISFNWNLKLTFALSQKLFVKSNCSWSRLKELTAVQETQYFENEQSTSDMEPQSRKPTTVLTKLRKSVKIFEVFSKKFNDFLLHSEMQIFGALGSSRSSASK